MSYIFLDESGCLGFNFKKKKTSKYFVISFLCMVNSQKKPLEKIVKKIYQGFSKKELQSHAGSLHCFKETPKTRIKLLTSLKEHKVAIMVIYLNKTKVYAPLQNEKQVLYNYVTNILLDRVFSKKLIPLQDGKIYLIAARRETSKFLNENFKAYLTNQMTQIHQTSVEVIIKNSATERCLQLVDFICWSVFRKYEYEDKTYSDVIQNLIVEENGLFK